jgi:RND family efflux transporter MFP subunit
MKNALWLIAVVLATAGCRKGDTEPPPEVVRPVKMMTVAAPGGPTGKRYPGTVRANEEVDLAFEVPGRVVQLPVKRGDFVAAGDLLAQLDERDYRNNRDAARATRDETFNTLERIKALRERQAATERELIIAQSAFDRADAELRIAAKALADCTLLAPFDGVVANRFFELYENVEAKQKIFSIQEIDIVKVIIDVPQRDVIRLPEGEAGTFEVRFAAVPDRVFTATVKEFVTEADPVTQTYEAAIIFPAPEAFTVLPGMTASVTWFPPAAAGRRMGADQDPVLVPAAAVFDDTGAEGAEVWVIDAETMRVGRRPVQIGRIVEGDMIEILAGLSAGELIATAGVHHLREGMQVSRLGGGP